MAQTGTVVLTSGVITGHQSIYPNASYTTFAMSIESGNFPAVSYKITKAEIEYTIRDARRDEFTVKAYDAAGNEATISASNCWANENITRTWNLITNYAYSRLKTIKLCAVGTGGMQIRGGTAVKITVTWELDQISSDFTINQTNLYAGNSFHIAVSPAVNTYGHRWVCTFGGRTSSGIMEPGTLSANIEIPMEWLDQIPAAMTGSGTITVYTWQTNYDNVFAQSYSKKITINAPSSVGPSIAGKCGVTRNHVVGGITYADLGIYVQGKSGFTATIKTPVTQHGASITAYRITGGGYTAYSNKLTSGLLMSAGDNVIQFTVTDSRGLSATVQSTISVTPYTKPAITSMSAWRTDANGVSSTTGEYGQWSCAWSYDSLNGKNTFSTSAALIATDGTSTELMWLKAANDTTSWVANMAGEKINLPSTNRYDLRLTVADQFSSVTKVIELPSANFAIHWNATGDGICFGGASTASGAVEIASSYDLIFKRMRYSALMGQRANATVSDLNTALEYGIYQVVPPATNAPGGNTYGVLCNILNAGTAFNGASNWLYQIYMPTNKVGIWYRNRINDGSFSSWMPMAEYRVGAIYMSTDETSPASIYGGTWTQITDRFLVGAGKTYSVHEAKGNATHTHTTQSHVLTIDEIPSHKHAITDAPGANSGSEWIGKYGTGGKNTRETTSVGGSGAHSHGNTGSASNIPPYYAVYIWRRTA